MRAGILCGLCFGALACDIPIPDNVFSCREQQDCPDGFVCQSQRCRASAHGPLAGTGMVGLPNQGMMAGSGGAAGSGGSSGQSGGPAAGTVAPDPEPIAACRGKAAGAQVCEDGSVKRCTEDLTQLEHVRDCGEHARCKAGAQDADCACDDGYTGDQAGNCQNVNDCPKDACKPGGRCVDALNDYQCTCDKGYEGTNSKACKEIDECSPRPCGAGTSGCVDQLSDFTCTCKDGYRPSGKSVCANIYECGEANACTPAYPCIDQEPFYYCRGQYLIHPMPDVTPEATQDPNYVHTTDTINDVVTGLSWQRNLPTTYPGCTQMLSAMGDACRWDEAYAYCDALFLDGYTEWRMPSKIELESLLDLTVMGAAHPSPFAGTTPTTFWSSSPYLLMTEPQDPRHYWYVDFKEGWSYHGSTMWDMGKVRCVK